MTIQDLLEEMSDQLAAEHRESIQELLDVGEEGVALESLVDHVIEFDLSVTPAFKDAALTYAETMGLRGRRWEYLRREIRVR